MSNLFKYMNLTSKKTLTLIGCFFLLNQESLQAQIDRTDEVKKLLSVDTRDTVAIIRGGVLAMGINQGFLHNWPAGGELASITVNAQFSGFINRIYHRHLWANNLDATYGLFYAFSNQFVPRKIDDRLDVTTKYGYQLGNRRRFFFSALINFRTQFTPGYDYKADNWPTAPTSDFLSPAYLTPAIGMEFREREVFSLFFSPAASRITFASKKYTSRLPEGAFGIKYGNTVRYELGAYFTSRLNLNINERFLFKSRLDLYANYLAKDEKDQSGKIVKKDSPANIDVLFDNFLSYKMTKLFSLNFGATFIYDNDIPYQKTTTNASTGLVEEKNEPGKELGWLQSKQIMSIGFEYRF